MVQNFSIPYVMQIKVTAVSSLQKRELQLQYLSPDLGLLQTPGWHPKAGVTYPGFLDSMDSWARIRVPARHVIMCSFLHVQLSPAVGVFFFLNSRSIGSHGHNVENGVHHRFGAYEKSGQRPHLTFIFSALGSDPVTVRFRVKRGAPSYAGFRLLFTFHPKSEMPQQLPNRKWNCSATNWERFKPHLACNAISECSDGRDEAECAHKRCNDVGFEVNGRCYILQFAGRVNDIQSINELCMKEGARLASLASVKEYRDVTGVAWQHQEFTLVVGLYSTSGGLPTIYKPAAVWEDKTIAYATHYQILQRTGYPFCGRLHAEDPHWAEFKDLKTRSSNTWTNIVQMSHCLFRRYGNAAYLCEFDRPSSPENRSDEILQIADLRKDTLPGAGFTSCPSNHFTHNYLACDALSACWAVGSVTFGEGKDTWDIPSPDTCRASMTSLPPSFACVRGGQRVPYTLVCDHRQDCSDNSDESFCVHPTCPAGQVPCGSSRQCYPFQSRCDGQKDCINGDDEGNCEIFSVCNPRNQRLGYQPPPPAPALIDFNKGCDMIHPLNRTHGDSHPCPETHYQCWDNGYCLPVFTRCNSVYDCPQHEDEASCDSYMCPGYYRCRGSTVCLHPSHVCDGMYHCPRSDDELLCDLHCPEQCTCHGLAFTCPETFPARSHPRLRYVNAIGSSMTLELFVGNTMLVYLSLANCNLNQVGNVSLPNLNILDLSNNRLTTIRGSTAEDMPNLKALFLSNNPLSSFLSNNVVPSRIFSKVEILEVSKIELDTVNDRLVTLFPNIRMLNLSQCGTHRVMGRGFQTLTQLRVLDLTGCPLSEIDKGILQGLDHLQVVHADNYKVCCLAALPQGFNAKNCHAPVDEISSCDDLLRSNAYRGVLAMFSALAILGNLGSFAFRLVLTKRSGSPGFSVFVLHLCASDFIMGVYLAVIGIADKMYQNSYVWEDTPWRHSSVCKLAGFLSLLSCEVSAFIVCLITLDRFLVVRFPLSFLHFKGFHAQLASSASWLMGFCLAAVPLASSTAHWEFYSQTGICIPLPVTRKQFGGHQYAFAVMIALNFVLFLIIAFGQAAIFAAVRSNTMTGMQTSQASQDADIARRLFTIAMTDFLCWFPIGLLGLLASQGLPISGEVNIVMAIIVLPLNSAMNPFLYTLNVMLEKRRRAKENRLLKWIKSQEES